MFQIPGNESSEGPNFLCGCGSKNTGSNEILNIETDESLSNPYHRNSEGWKLVCVLI